MRFLSRFFDSNDRELGRIQPLVDETNELEPEFEALSDEEIRERIAAHPRRDRRGRRARGAVRGRADHPDLERRRELAKARRKRDNERIQTAARRRAAGGVRRRPARR